MAFDGTKGPAGNIVPPGVAGYIENGWADAHYDVERAKAALVVIGYAEAQGIEKLSLPYLSGAAGHEQTAQQIQADLAEINIEVELESLEKDAYLKRIDEGEFSFAFVERFVDFPIIYNSLHQLLDWHAPGNKSFYTNPEIDDSIARLDETMREAQIILDPRDRADKMAESNWAIARENLVIPLAFPKHAYVISERLGNFTFGPMRLADYTSIWIPADMQ
jgi:peptide/nickel transport system substrate-binding protein/oligopeptide transport system substrate-binding protein